MRQLRVCRVNTYHNMQLSGGRRLAEDLPDTGCWSPVAPWIEELQEQSHWRARKELHEQICGLLA